MKKKALSESKKSQKPRDVWTKLAEFEKRLDHTVTLGGGWAQIVGVADDLLRLCEQQAAAMGRIRAALLEVEQHCPCGARPESPDTHPHVSGCQIYEALSATKGGAK